MIKERLQFSLPVTPVAINRIAASLVLPGEPNVSPRRKADVLIEDAIARREISKTEKALVKKIMKDLGYV